MSSLEEHMTPDQQVEAAEIDKAFREILKTDAGKRVVFWMLEQCAIYQEPLGISDAATNYAVGRQSTGRRLIEMLDQIDPRFYPKLLLDIAEIKAMDRAAAKTLAENQEEDDEVAP